MSIYNNIDGSYMFYPTYTTTTYTGWDRIDQLEKELKKSKELIRILEKKLNDFIDNPEKVRNIRQMDPFEEEVWDE